MRFGPLHSGSPVANRKPLGSALLCLSAPGALKLQAPMSPVHLSSQQSFIEWFRTEREQEGSNERVVHLGVFPMTYSVLAETSPTSVCPEWSFKQLPTTASLKAARAVWAEVVAAAEWRFFVADVEQGTFVLAVLQGLFDKLDLRLGLLNWSKLTEASYDYVNSLCPTKYELASLHQSLRLVGFGTLVIWRRSEPSDVRPSRSGKKADQPSPAKPGRAIAPQ